MNVRCPSCQTVFRVDPARVPEAGVRARCARCSATFALTRQGVAADGAPRTQPHAGGPTAREKPPETTASPQAGGAPAAPAEPPARPAEPDRAPAPVGASQVPQTGAPVRPTASAPATGPDKRVSGAPSTGTTPSKQASPQAPQAPPTPAPPSGREGRVPVFGSRDPKARAQRIARALVSDIVAYHPKRRDECLAAGTLRTEFRDEIMKSWEEYVAQVGLDTAKATPYFRNALNDILARGQQIF